MRFIKRKDVILKIQLLLISKLNFSTSMSHEALVLYINLIWNRIKSKKSKSYQLVVPVIDQIHLKL